MKRKKLTILSVAAVISCSIYGFISTPQNVEAKEIRGEIQQNYKFVESLQNTSFKNIEEISKLKNLNENEKSDSKNEIRKIISDFSEDIKDINSKENLSGINRFKVDSLRKIYNVVMRAKEKDKLAEGKNAKVENNNSYNKNYKFVESLQNTSFKNIEEVSKLKNLNKNEKSDFKNEIRKIISDFSEDIKDIDSKENLSGINRFKVDSLRKIYNVVMRAKEKNKIFKNINNFM